MAVKTYALGRSVRRGPRPALAIVIGAIATLGLAAAPAAASADTVNSANWSGYAAHKPGVSFRAVSGSWTQPTAVCANRAQTFSAFWVGLGGYASTSNALEQIGTQLDCNSSGKSVSTAWYELVPAPSTTIKMTVKPGDHMTSSVTVSRRQVTLRLSDSTRHESFSKRVTPSTIDVSSAEWIAEAPSACVSANFCEPLPLTDYSSMRFSAAKASTAAGHTGAISSPLWGTTEIVLSSAGARRFIANDSTSNSTPSSLTGAGTSFEVRYSQATVSPTPQPSMAKDASGSATVQPGGARSAG